MKLHNATLTINGVNIPYIKDSLKFNKIGNECVRFELENYYEHYIKEWKEENTIIIENGTQHIPFNNMTMENFIIGIVL